jgi:hypothetical protein
LDVIDHAGFVTLFLDCRKPERTAPRSALGIRTKKIWCNEISLLAYPIAFGSPYLGGNLGRTATTGTP